jgi:nicotinate-nucleotide adenylyltransferase
MPKPTRKIGLMGGGFDPIHWGHLGAAIESAYQVGLEKVLLSATGQPPHKQPIASAEHRFEMTRLAALEAPFPDGVLEATRLELDAPGPHFTVETLRRLQAQEPDAQLHLIVGTDAAKTLEDWRAIEEILSLARIIVVERVGFTQKESETLKTTATDFTKGTENNDYNPRVRSASPTIQVRWPGVAISSSEIRRRVATGAPIQYLIPRSVADYLKRFDLYR